MFTTLSVLLAGLCLVPAVPKVTAHPHMRAAAEHFGIAWQHYQLIGMAELAAAAGLVAGLAWRPIGVLAAVGLAVLLGGAILTHMRSGDSARRLLPALLMLAIDALYLVIAITA